MLHSDAREHQQQLLDQYNKPINFEEKNPLVFLPPSNKTIQITCPKCLNPASHHSHKRQSRGCRLNPDINRTLLEKVAISILGGEEHGDSTGIVSKKDLQNAESSEISVDQIYTEMCGSVDSQTHSWADLPQTKKNAAFAKAIDAYDKFGAWDRNSDKNANAFKNYKSEMKHKGIEVVVEDMMVVLGAKLDPNTKEIIGKVRIAPRGYNDKTWESIVYSTSPTVTHSSVRVCDIHGMRAQLLQILIDFSDAFFQTKTIAFYHGDRRVVWLMVTDPGIIPGASRATPIFRQLLKETPGCKNASRRWYERICEILSNAGYVPTSFDKSFFVKHEGGALIGAIPLHVDDAKCRLTLKEFQNLENIFKNENIVLNFFRKVNFHETIEFCGIMYTESERGMLVHQKPYIEKKLQLLPKISLKNDQLLEENDLKTYGQAIGKLIWILPTNVETCFEITFLSRFRNSASAGLYKRLNQLIYRIREAPGVVFLPRLRAQYSIKTIMIADASSGEAPPEETGVRPRDHGMQICLLGEATPPGVAGRAGIVSSSSSKLNKVTHSSFDSEAINNVDSLDLAINVNETSTEVGIGVCPNRRDLVLRQEWFAKRQSCEVHSDSHSFTRLVKLGLTHVLSRRRARDIEDARQALQDEDISIFLHVSGLSNPSDVGTKKNPAAKAVEALREVLAGFYTPVASPLTNTSMNEELSAFLESLSLKVIV